LTPYADTSFLFSFYIPDANATAAAAAMSGISFPLLTTDFGEFELTNAVSWRVFRKNLSAEEASAVLNLFARDAESGVLRVLPLPAAAFQRARQIARASTPVLGTRALDVLHVASALALRADTFYTFDRNQAKLAAAHGLRVL
jgi:predicted nucleic acid-binding protein